MKSVEIDRVVIAIAEYVDQLGLVAFVDETGPALWVGDAIRQGFWRSNLRNVEDMSD